MAHLKIVFLLILTGLIHKGLVKSDEPLYPDFTCPLICKCNMELATNKCGGLGLTNLTNILIHPVSTVLDLSSNKLKVIPNELVPLTNLQYLYLQNNHIKIVTFSDLKSLQNLRVLDLSNNHFNSKNSFEMTVLNSLKKLRSFDISNNRLYNFPDFDKVTNPLTLLNIANCSINNMMYNILKGFKNIQKLNLSNNPLQDISHIESKSLKYLDVMDCNIQHIMLMDMIRLPNLTNISIARNYQLKTFNSNVNFLKDVTMPNCNLNEIPAIHSSNLINLDLEGNRILEIERNAFQNMSQLETLSLSNNIITFIDENAFNDLTNLKFLDLSFNRITELKAYAFHLTKGLTHLNLSHNYVAKINMKAPVIKTLDVSHCEIKSLEKTDLRGMPYLRTLNVSHNWLSTLPNNLDAANLTNLDVSMCGIWTLNNATFANVKNLNVLNMQGNRLSSIKKDVFHKIESLHLGDNPWRCDCDNIEFQNLYLWLRENERLVDQYELLCRSPVMYEGKHWSVACASRWNVEPNQLWIYSIVGVVVFSILFCMFLHFIRRCNAKRTRAAQAAVRQEERREAQARLQRMRRNAAECRQEADRNAPDPRDVECPPNYDDAIRLPRPMLSTSSASLSECRSTCTSEGKKSASKAKESKRRPLRPRSAVLHNYRQRVTTSRVLQDIESHLETTLTTPSSITSDIEHDYEVISNNGRTRISSTGNYTESSV